MTDRAPDSDSARSTPRESDALFDRLLAGDLSPDEIDALPDDMKEAARSIKDGSDLFGQRSILKTTIGHDSRPTLAPRRFGRFVLIEEIGRGGQGAVWRAKDTERGDDVALKYLDRWVRSKEPLARFEREQAILSRLEHSAIARVRDSGIERGVPWIAMEFVPGKSLSAWIDDVKRGGDKSPFLERKRLLEFFIAVARGLHSAHERGIVHRDIKPGNIMVRPDGRPVILDFGLARDLLDSNALTQTGDLLGTPAYLAPEQLTRQSIPADRRTDVYSLGAALFEALTLRLPFVEPTRERLYAAILTAEPPALSAIDPSIKGPLSVVVATALEKDRNRRYATAELFADDLERALREVPILARPLSWPAQIFRAAKRRPATAVAVGLLFLICALGGFIVARWGDIERGRDADRREELTALLEQGYLLLGEGEPKDAESVFDSAIESDPKSVEAWVGRIISKMIRRDMADAHTALLDAEKAIGRLPALKPIEHRLRRSDSDQAPERIVLDESTADDLTLFVAGQLALADAHAGDGKGFTEACRWLRMACLRSDHVRRLLVFELSHAATHADDKEILHTVTGDLTRRWPNSSKAHFWSGFADLEKAPDRAIEKFRAALRIEPGLQVARYNLAHALNVAGRYAESIAETNIILAERPGNPDAILTKSDGLIAEGKAAEAILLIESMVVDARIRARAHLARAKALIDLSRHHEALPILDAMIERGEAVASSRLQRAFVNFALQRTKAGFEDLEASLAADPQNTEALATMVRALIETGRLDGCPPFAERIVDRPDASSRQLAAAAFGLAVAKKFKRAEEIADRIACDGKDAETTTTLARTYFSIGAEKKSIRLAEMIADRDPRARWLLAKAAAEHGRFDEAIDIWKKTVAESAALPSLAASAEQQIALAERLKASALAARAAMASRPEAAGTAQETAEWAVACSMLSDFETYDRVIRVFEERHKKSSGIDPLSSIRIRALALRLERTPAADRDGRRKNADALIAAIDRLLTDVDIARDDLPASTLYQDVNGVLELNALLRVAHSEMKLETDLDLSLSKALDRLTALRAELIAESNSK